MTYESELQYRDIIRYENMSFEDYLKLDGRGFSFYKREKDGVASDIKITHKILLGKMVDNILDGSSDIDIKSELYPVARAIVQYLLDEFGEVIKLSKKQMSFSGKVFYEGIFIPTTGRTDFLLGKKILIDLKVNHNIRNYEEGESLINYMGYDYQLFHYSRLSGNTICYLLVYSTKAKRCFLFRRLEKEDSLLNAENFWVNKIVEHGII